MGNTVLVELCLVGIALALGFLGYGLWHLGFCSAIKICQTTPCRKCGYIEADCIAPADKSS